MFRFFVSDSRNKKLLVTGATLLVTGALLVVTRSSSLQLTSDGASILAASNLRFDVRRVREHSLLHVCRVSKDRLNSFAKCPRLHLIASCYY